MSEFYCKEKCAGTCKHKDKTIEFYPNRNAPLPDCVNDALMLQSVVSKKVIFVCPYKEYKTLIKLYARELRRKYKPSEMIKLRVR